MYADDTVLMAESPEELQKMLDSLKTYTVDWNLFVNTEKTKVLIFRNGGNIREKDHFLYNGKELELVDCFNYLGILLNFNGKFYQTQKLIADQGRKALFALTK